MQRRIKTQMYDTNTARLIGEYINHINDETVHEILYKKRTGEYFLCIKPEKSDNNVFSIQESIQPISYTKAKEWFKKANKTDKDLATDDVYNYEFGIPTKSEEREMTTIKLSRLAKRKLERMSIKQGISQSKIIEKLILAE